MIIDRKPDGIDVYVRQSWLNEFRTCPERARRSLHSPSVATDLSMVGTAVHAAIEQWIGNQQMTSDEMADRAALAWAATVAAEPTARWTRLNHEQGEAEARRLARSWFERLRHKVDSVVGVERDFCVLFDTTQFVGVDVNIYLTGTIDLIQTHSLWDWKTSSKKYGWRDTQLQNIQSSVYAAAVKRLGILDYPIEMNFAVMVRGTDNTDVCTVRRDASHEAWLRRMILPAVRQMLIVGDGLEWPMNDTSALCSPDWCSAWADCKGSHIEHIPYPTRSK